MLTRALILSILIGIGVGLGLAAGRADALSGKFWHITDVHVDPNYLPNTDQKTECHSGKGTAGEFSDYLCDTSLEMMASSINVMPTIEPDVDFVFYTGDAYPHVNESSKEMLLAALQYVTDGLLATYKNTTAQVLPILGNHDIIPCHQMPVGPSWIYEDVAKMWSDWLRPEETQTFLKGGYYTRLLLPGLRVVAYNSILYYISNKATLEYSDPAGQFAWLNATLAAAEAAGETVWVIGHTAPGVTERSGGAQMHDQFLRPLLDVFQPYHESGVIASHFYGHLHTDTFRILPGGGSALLAPAVDMWYNYWSGEGSNNPSVRLFEYSSPPSSGSEDGGRGANFTVTKYTQYYTDLGGDNRKGSIAWMKEYATDQPPYSLPSLSASAMLNLYQQCIVGGGGGSDADTCFDQYLKWNSVLVPAECDAECKTKQKCAVAHILMDDFKKCAAVL